MEPQHDPAAAVAGAPTRPQRPAQPPTQPPSQPSAQAPDQPPATARKASRPPLDYDQVPYSRKPHEVSVFIVPAERRVQFWSMFLKNWHVTITYCFVFWSFGMCVAFLGPTLGDLGCQTETPFATMSWVFFAQALFTLLGSIVGGVLVQRIMDGKSMLPGMSCLPFCSGSAHWRTSAHGAMLVSLLMLAVTLAMVPQCWSLSMLALNLAAMGLFMGIIDTVANLCMIQLYGSNVAPFLQALHFFYALGAFASPMINEPFLLKNPHHCFALIDDILQARGNSTENEAALLEILQHSKIQYGFEIMALLQIPVAILVITVLLRKRKGSSSETYEIDESGGLTVHHVPSEGVIDDHNAASTRQVALVTICAIVLCFMYDGLQGAYGGYIYSYARKMVSGLTATEGAYLTSCFWGTFAVGRLVSIGVATKLSPAFMIMFNIVGCGMAALLMLIWQHSRLVVYAGTCLFGLSLSSIYPTTISLAETYIDVSSVITSLIVVGAAAGEMVQPVVVGHEFESVGPVMFQINVILVVLISIIVVFVLFVVGASIKNQAGLFRLFRCCMGSGSDPGEDTGLMSQHVTYYSRMPHEVSSSELHFNPNGKGS
ncbi:major facilitator superfamily domain-containing protein 4A-like isoform X1 [Amphibalanus amphitrite]|nr:major facilitator superfamily domain-containing protein 4A-like isoform X1 [Amphibalanus amphitrite]